MSTHTHTQEFVLHYRVWQDTHCQHPWKENPTAHQPLVGGGGGVSECSPRPVRKAPSGEPIRKKKSGTKSREGKTHPSCDTVPAGRKEKDTWTVKINAPSGGDASPPTEGMGDELDMLTLLGENVIGDDRAHGVGHNAEGDGVCGVVVLGNELPVEIVDPPDDGLDDQALETRSHVEHDVHEGLVDHFSKFRDLGGCDLRQFPASQHGGGWVFASQGHRQTGQRPTPTHQHRHRDSDRDKGQRHGKRDTQGKIEKEWGHVQQKTHPSTL